MTSFNFKSFHLKRALEFKSNAATYRNCASQMASEPQFALFAIQRAGTNEKWAREEEAKAKKV